MPATAENLRDLHALHLRARTLRDLMESGPKTLANRQAILAARKAALEEARDTLKHARAAVKEREMRLAGMQTRYEDLGVKLNTVKKQDEYNAIVHQRASDKKAMDALEDEILNAMTANDEHAAELAAREAEVKALEAEVEALRGELEGKAQRQRAQLDELDAAIRDAEAILPADQREQYRRNVKQRGADALAAVESGACTGCFVTVTAQMLNELINAEGLVFCKTCGRLLYMADDHRPGR